MKRPWFKFYPTDWTGDQRLRRCSFSARGLWIDLCSYMHEGDPYGHLDIDGLNEADEIAALTGRPVAETKQALSELEKRGVLSRTPGGVIFSRRMVRDGQKSENGRSEIQKRWGQSDSKTRSQRIADARKKGTHSRAEWVALTKVTGERCLKCGDDDIVRDHVIPIYRGGDDSIENIQPLCRSCNASKGNDTTDHRPSDWHERLMIYLSGDDGKVTRLMPRSPGE